MFSMAVILYSVFFRLSANTFVESLNLRQNVFELCKEEI
jgi:hypothetical protein